MPKTLKRKKLKEATGIKEKKRKRKQSESNEDYDQNEVDQSETPELINGENYKESDYRYGKKNETINENNFKDHFIGQSTRNLVEKENDSIPTVKAIIKNIRTNCTIIDVEHFIQSFQKFNSSETKDDAVLEYLKNTKSCIELTNFLKDIDRDPSEVVLIFCALEQILLRVADDLRQFENSITSMVNVISTTYQRLFYRMLKQNKKSTVKATLQLLISMVLLNRNSAQKIITGFSFTHPNMASLLNKTDLKDPQDVRSTYIMFLISFLMSDCNHIIALLIQQKGVLNSVFDKLKNDKVKTIQMFLSTILSKIVLNPNVAKSHKILLLNDSTLKRVMDLYQWEGPISWKRQKKFNKSHQAKIVMKKPLAEEEQVVAELAHEFLLGVCCSYKNGILFQDSSCGTMGRNFNHLLTNILSAIPIPFETSYSEDLAFNILINAPDQMKFYLLSIKDHFKPRLTSQWESLMKFLCKLIEKQNIVLILEKANFQGVTKLASIVSVLIMPSVFTSSDLSQALKLNSLRIHHTILMFLLTILKRIQDLINFIESGNQNFSFLPSSEIPAFLNAIRISLVKYIPDSKSFMTCWEEANKYANDKRKENKKDTEVKAVTDLEDIPVIKHLQILTEVHLLLKQILPSTEHLLDLTEIFMQIELMNDIENENMLGKIKLELIQTLVFSESGSRMFTDMRTSRLFIDFLLNMTSSTNDASQTAGKLLRKLLEDNGFIDEQKEIVLWLYHLRKLPEEKRQLNVEFLKSSLINMIENQSEHWDRIEECHSLISLHHGDENYLNKILLAECSSTSYVEKNHVFETNNSSLTYNTYSLLVPAALTVQHENENFSQDNQEFLTAVLLDVLHVQDDPSSLCILLQKYSSLFPKYFRSYLKCFKYNKNMKPKLSDNDQNSLKAILQDFFAKRGISLFTDDEFLKCPIEFSEADDFEIFLLTYQCCLYLKICFSEQDHLFQPSFIVFLCKILLEIVKHRSNSVISCFNLTVNNIHTILKHPDILNFFFHEDSVTDDVSKACKAVTNLVVKIAKFIKKDNLGKTVLDAEPLMESYFKKFLKVLNSYFNGSDSNDRLKLNQNAIKACMDVLSFDDVCQVLEHASIDDIKQHRWLLASLCAKMKENSVLNSKLIIPSFILHKWTDLSTDVNFLEENKQLVNYFPSHFTIVDSVLGSILDNLKKFDEIPSSLLNILQNMITQDISCWTHFQYWFLDTLNYSTVTTDILPVVETYLRNSVCYFQEDSLLSGEIKVMSKKFYCLYNEYVTGCLFSDRFNQFSSELFVNCCSLLNSFLHLNLMKVCKIIQHLSNLSLVNWKNLFLHENGIFAQLAVSLLEQNKVKEKETYICLYVIYLCCLDTSFTWQCDNIHKLVQVLSNVIKSDKVLIQDAIHIKNESVTWIKFLKSLLKTAFSHENCSDLLELMLTVSSKMVSKENSHDKKGFKFDELHEIICGHSSCFPIMMEELPGFQVHKDILVDIFQLLCSRDPSVFNSSHIPFFLASYKATLRKTDQKILHLIYMYESNGISTRQFRPFMWGNAAGIFYSIQKNLTYSLENEPRIEEVLQLFDCNQLTTTALNFPLDMKLMPEVEVFSSDQVPPEQMYDPRFLLPLLGYMMGPENFVKCQTIVESKILSVAFASLSSNDGNMRAAGYFVLTSFIQHLEGSRYRYRFVLLHLFKALAQGILTPNKKLSNVTTIFFVKAVDLLLSRKVENLYFDVTSFITLKPQFDVNHVPEFLKLFNSSDFKEFRTHRKWILNLLVQGLRDEMDFQTYERSFVFKIILSYCNSPLCNDSERVQILSLIEASSKIPSVANLLVKNYGILSHLRSVLLKHNTEEVFTKCVIIVSCIWATLTQEPFSIKTNNDSHDISVVRKNPPLRARYLVEISVFLVTLLKMFKKNPEFQLLEIWKLFLSLLSSVCKHCAKNDETVSHSHSCFTLSSNEFLQEILFLHKKIMKSNNIDLSSLCPPSKHISSNKTFLYENSKNDDTGNDTTLHIAHQCHDSFIVAILKGCSMWMQCHLPKSSCDEPNNLFSIHDGSCTHDHDTLLIIFEIIEIVLDYLCCFPEKTDMWTELITIFMNFFQSPERSREIVEHMMKNYNQSERILSKLFNFNPTIIELPNNLKLFNNRRELWNERIALLHHFNDVWVQFFKEIKSCKFPSLIKKELHAQRTPLLFNVFHLINTKEYKSMFNIVLSHHQSILADEYLLSESKIRAINLFLCEILLGKKSPSHFKATYSIWNVSEELSKLKTI